MNKRGVTLIELIIVFVIISICALLMVPNIGAWLPGYRLRTATREVASTLRTAQMKAVTNNTIYGVGFTAGTSSTPGSCQLYRGTTAEGAAVTLPAGVNFVNNTFPVNGDLATPKPYARFNADSTSSGGSVELQNTKGTKKITLTTATGRAKIE